MRVQEVMTAEVVVVSPQAPLKEVARLLARDGVGGVPVVESGTVIGVVLESDFVRGLGGGRTRRWWLEELLGRPSRPTFKATSQRAGEAMSAPAIVVDPSAEVRDAAALMMKHNVNRLPVVSEGRLVGIVTRGDLVAIFTRSADAIAASLREAVRAVMA